MLVKVMCCWQPGMLDDSLCSPCVMTHASSPRPADPPFVGVPSYRLIKLENILLNGPW